MSKKTLRVIVTLAVVLVLVGSGYAYYQSGEHGTDDPTDGGPFGLTVPVIVTPSLQLASGQVLLYKVSNVSEQATSFRIMFFTDDSNVPTFYKDYERVGPGRTVNYVYRPPTTTVQVEDKSVEAPQAVRASFVPIPTLADPGVTRRIVANVQIMRVQDGAKGGAATFENPIVVPLTRCNYEPRSIVPGRNWYWNCAPDMYPVKPIPPA
jgi:hypothetical protein